MKACEYTLLSRRQKSDSVFLLSVWAFSELSSRWQLYYRLMYSHHPKKLFFLNATDKIFASYFITEQQWRHNSLERKSFLMLTARYELWELYTVLFTLLKTQTLPQSFASPTIIMGDVSLFIIGVFLNPTGASRSSSAVYNPMTYLSKPSFVSSEARTNESQMSGRTQP